MNIAAKIEEAIYNCNKNSSDKISTLFMSKSANIELKKCFANNIHWTDYQGFERFMGVKVVISKHSEKEITWALGVDA